MQNHEYSWEMLYHFNCGECKNWWSYTTTETAYQWKSQKMFCPHCGYHTAIQPKDMKATNELDEGDRDNFATALYKRITSRYM
jgi:hypothetical protein